MRSVILIILDGWGIGRKDYSNPLYIAKPKNIDYVKTHYLSGALQSSGIAVGLPWDEEGNSEVGHLTIGAGKIIYQHFPRITLSIQNGEFFKNRVLLQTFEHAKKNNSAVHLAGLLTQGNVHSSLEHVRALIACAKKQGVAELNLHFFSDGKDSPPRSVLELLGTAKKFTQEFGLGTLATLAGRYYALDRDEHWERTERTYQILTGQGEAVPDLATKIHAYYDRGLTDEFVEPLIIGPNAHPIRDGDALIFFDFREDSIRQIASAFILKGFDKFKVLEFKNLFVATMTSYADKFKVPVLFPNDTIDNPLGRILAEHDRLQMRIAETEKYAHITYFFNGYRDKPFTNEYRVLIPSRNVARREEAPEMMSKEVAARVIESIDAGGFDFILANFASPDMIAHTGNYDAALQAIMIVDEEIGRIMKACLEKGVILMITSDHGNIERMVDPFTGRIETKHDPNLVPLYLVAKEFERVKSEAEVDWLEKEAVGILSDVAPTILEIMELPRPKEMTGQSLLKNLR